MPEQTITIHARTAPTTVYRYRLPIVDQPTLQLPRFAQVLAVGRSRDGLDALDLWAAVDPTQAAVEVRFAVVGTGGPLPTPAAYLGTVEHADGALIFHVFRLTDTDAAAVSSAVPGEPTDA